MNARGFSLIEAIAAIVILGLVAPISMVTLRDAAASRADSIRVNRASWLASAVMETVLGDVSSRAGALGFDALADANAYRSTPGTGLDARLSSVTDHYRELGFEWSLDVGGLVASDGMASGDASLDIYRTISVRVTWIGALRGSTEYRISMMVCEMGDGG